MLLDLTVEVSHLVGGVGPVQFQSSTPRSFPQSVAFCWRTGELLNSSDECLQVIVSNYNSSIFRKVVSY